MICYVSIFHHKKNGICSASPTSLPDTQLSCGFWFCSLITVTVNTVVRVLSPPLQCHVPPGRGVRGLPRHREGRVPPAGREGLQAGRALQGWSCCYSHSCIAAWRYAVWTLPGWLSLGLGLCIFCFYVITWSLSASFQPGLSLPLQRTTWLSAVTSPRSRRCRKPLRPSRSSAETSLTLWTLQASTGVCVCSIRVCMNVVRQVEQHLQMYILL